MKKNLLTTLLIVAAGLSAAPAWAEEVPLPQGIGLQNELSALWTIGVMDMPRSDEGISRCTLRYLIYQGLGSGYATNRKDNPSKFIGVPNNFTGALSWLGVRRTAERLFGRAPSDITPIPGTMKRGSSYYVDFNELSNKTGNILNLKASQLRPTFVRYDNTAEKDKDGTFTIRGDMVRVAPQRDGSTMVTDQAEFTAKVKRSGFDWKLEGLRIRNKPLG